MPAVTYTFYATDESGRALTGLQPAWVGLKLLKGGAPVTPLPAIVEHDFGQYKFDYDPEASGEAGGRIDLGVPGLSELFGKINFTTYAGDSRITSAATDASLAKAAAAIPAPRVTLDAKATAAMIAAQMPTAGPPGQQVDVDKLAAALVAPLSAALLGQGGSGGLFAHIDAELAAIRASLDADGTAAKELSALRAKVATLLTP